MNTKKTSAYARKYLLAYTGILLAACLIWLAPGCNKETKDITVNAKQPENIYTVGWIKASPKGNAVRVWFHQSIHIYTLDKNTPNADLYLSLLSRAKESRKPLRVMLNKADNTITLVANATTDEITAFDLFESKICLKAIEVDHQLFRAGTGCNDTIPCDSLTAIFDYLKGQGCKSATPPANCIPFECVYDGCDARADKMRELLEARGWCSEKIFAFGSLEVNATLNGNNCCVTWGWHVAPVIKVKCGDSVVQRVLDPSMFNNPVSPGDWGNGMKADCDGDGVPGSIDSMPIKPPTYYQPGRTCYHINNNNAMTPYTDCLLDCYKNNCNGCTAGTVNCRATCDHLWK
jgi:Glutaminase